MLFAPLVALHKKKKNNTQAQQLLCNVMYVTLAVTHTDDSVCSNMT